MFHYLRLSWNTASLNDFLECSYSILNSPFIGGRTNDSVRIDRR